MKSWRREETAESGCFRGCYPALGAVSQHLDQQQGVKSVMLWLLLSEKGGTALGEYKQMSSRHLSYKAQIDFFSL